MSEILYLLYVLTLLIRKYFEMSKIIGLEVSHDVNEKNALMKIGMFIGLQNKCSVIQNQTTTYTPRRLNIDRNQAWVYSI